MHQMVADFPKRQQDSGKFAWISVDDARARRLVFNRAAL